jgi:hypothetical protein
VGLNRFWYALYPASVLWEIRKFDYWGIIAVLAIAVRKEMSHCCVVFSGRNFSVVLREHKHTKKRFGEGRRIFLMSFTSSLSKEEYESKIVPDFGL